MTKFNFSLTGVFDACRKIFNPTPEERAESERQFKIKRLSEDLSLAVRGVECIPPTKEEFINYGMRAGSAFMVLHLPYHYEPLEGEKREQRIEDISNKLQKLGVDELSIQKMIDDTKDAVQRSKDFDYPIGF